MKNKILFLLPLLFLLALGQSFGQDNEVSIPLTEAGKRGKLKVDIKMGSIIVKGTNRKDVKVSYTFYKSDEEEECCDHDKDNNQRSTKGLTKISKSIPGLEISELNNQVLVQAENWSKGINVTLEIPSDFDLSLHTYVHGNIEVGDIKGEIEIENYNGAITAKNISGTLVGSTYNGDIEVIFNQITPDSPLAFTTYHGNVDISFPAAYKGTIKAKTENGEVYTGFDMNLKKGNDQFKTKKTDKGTNIYIDNWITGDINGGGPEIMMRNHYGNIYIRKK